MKRKYPFFDMDREIELKRFKRLLPIDALNYYIKKEGHYPSSSGQLLIYLHKLGFECEFDDLKIAFESRRHKYRKSFLRTTLPRRIRIRHTGTINRKCEQK
eukprot:UN30664